MARNEFDYTIKEVAEGRHLSKIAGLSYRKADGIIVHNEERPILEDMLSASGLSVEKRMPADDGAFALALARAEG